MDFGDIIGPVYSGQNKYISTENITKLTGIYTLALFELVKQ